VLGKRHIAKKKITLKTLPGNRVKEGSNSRGFSFNLRANEFKSFLHRSLSLYPIVKQIAKKGSGTLLIYKSGKESLFELRGKKENKGL